MIYHLALVRDWDAALAAGDYRISTVGVTLEQAGFIHASRLRQIRGVAQAFYAGITEPMLLLHIDETALAAPWRIDPVPGSPDGFPHVYGPVATTAVVAAVPARRLPDGSWDGLPDGS
jgi:uncharacterized protein (DUF952 family)